MKKALLTIQIFFVSISLFALDAQNVKSKVTAVTIFTEVAQIEREAEINLKKGMNEIVLGSLPGELLEESVQVKGIGSAKITIIDVKTEDFWDDKIFELRQKSLQKSLDSLNALKKIIDDELSVLNSKQIFLDGLKNELPKSGEKGNQKTSPKEWLEMLNFLETGTRQVLESVRIQKNKKEKIELEIRQIDANRREADDPTLKKYKQVIVKLSAEESTNFKLKLIYITENVSWTPIYDARVNSGAKKLSLVSYAVVKQNTGENWDNISVTLSTAQPSAQTVIPDLEPDVIGNQNFGKIRGGRASESSFMVEDAGSMLIKYITDYSSSNQKGSIIGKVTDSMTNESLALANVIVNGTSYGAVTNENGNYKIIDLPPGFYSIRFSYLGYGNKTVTNVEVKAGKTAILNSKLNESNHESQEVMVVADKPLLNPEYTSENESASIVDEFINVSYQVKSKQDIPSDNFEHKFQISSSEYDLMFDYFSVPKVTEKTFLLGKFVNNSDNPIIEGDVNIFVDQNYITHSHLLFIAPKDTSKLSLGSEELMPVSRKLIKKYVESKGFLSSKSKESYEYEITVKNFRQTEETVTIKDQAPVSWNENTKVTILKPSPLEAVIDNQNLITWKISLKPGETRKLNLSFEVVQ